MKGHPPVPRVVQRRFWRAVAEGLSTEEAAVVAQVSATTGLRLFGKAGGMPPLSLAEPSGRYLSLVEREHIAIWRAEQVSVGEIGRRLGRSPSTVSRELARGARPYGSGHRPYLASVAHARAEDRARRPKVSKLAGNDRLRGYVQDALSGPSHYSPEQISNRLRIDFPDDEAMRISDEAIGTAPGSVDT